MVSTTTHHRGRVSLLFLICSSLVAVGGVQGAKSPYTVHMQPLPGATAAGVTMDYIAFAPTTGFLWAPAGNTGLVAVIDTSSGAVKQITGFPTAEMGSGERKRVVGPSSVTVGDRVVYIGNRGDSTVCAFDARSLVKGTCHQLDSMPDGLASAELGGLVLERLLGVRTGEARPHGFHFCGVTTTSSVRPECLNAHWFSTLDDARRTIEDWRTDYNDAFRAVTLKIEPNPILR